MTALHRLGSRLSAYVSAVVESPPLLGLVVGSWIAVMSLFTAANPVMSFLAVAPMTMVLWYAVLYGVRRLSGEPLVESSAPNATTHANRAADVDEERAIVRLRERYADGEIDHAEFETRLEALVETEFVLSEAAPEATREPSVARER
ncbi:DUF1707 domain-containing protein [Halobellus sp. GM3]|uniref:DUF1707 domain-containing protein n=1 Tax=Halobellus sp. GM3 TaxID=3458410 RepID=UPI00403DF11A